MILDFQSTIMANYPTHLIGGIVVGLFGSSTSWYLGMISPFAIPVVALSGVLVASLQILTMTTVVPFVLF